VNEFNTNDKLNELHIKMLMQISALMTDREYDLGFDNQYIHCEKYDPKNGYKMKKDCFPSVDSTRNYTIYFENRNGNSNVKFHQDETLLKVFELFKTNNIKVDWVRVDCGYKTNL